MGHRRLPQYQCHVCGQTFRTPLAEARHRHNFPALCKRNAQFKAFMAEHHPPKKEVPNATDQTSD